jgi:hypothetical protein
MGQLAIPMLVGAGVGAAGGAAMGKNPFKTALLGAGIGAAGAGAGLFGGAGAAGAAGTAGTGAGAGLIGGANLSTAGGLGLGTGAASTTSGLGSIFSGLQGVETAPVSLGTGGYASGIGGQALNAAPTLGAVGNGEIGSSLLTNSKGTPLNMMDKVGNYISNIPSNTMDYVKNNPLTSAKTAFDMTASAPEAPTQDRSTPVRQGNAGLLYAPNFNTNPSSNLDTELQIGQTKDNAMGLLNALKTRIPLTDEEKAQLARLGQQY